MSPRYILIVMRLLYMFWLLVANALFVYPLSRRPHFVLRAVGGCLLALLFAALSGYIWQLIVAPIYQAGNIELINSTISLVTHVLFYFISLILLFFLFDEKPITLLFASISAYAANNITVTLENIMGALWPSLKFVSLGPITWQNTLAYLLCNFLPLIVLYLLFARSLNDPAKVAEFNSKQTLVLFSLILLVAVAIRSFSTAFGKESVVLFSLLNFAITCCCFFILYVQLSLKRSFGEQMEQETMREIAEEKAKQYSFAKETREEIDLRYHDLKHQLLALKGQGGVDPLYLEQLNQSLQQNDCAFKTGNEALDVVLADKALYCAKNAITLTVLADGSVLSFMSVSDIYSLFGNALDNAIEYVRKLPPEERLIKLFLSREGSFVSIALKNYFLGDSISLDKGLPATSKSDAIHHGYGTKSMKAIAERYGGSFSIQVAHHQFTVSILFPR